MISPVEGSVMVSSPVPGAVEVVGHHVDEVQVLCDPGHVVAVVDPELGGRHRGGQKPVVLREGVRELLNQTSEILFVIPSSISVLTNQYKIIKSDLSMLLVF